ncbi:uncharacterized protein LOC106642275 [Copidosoma floridanum]|uniref:uncharacterized protein LOC106642275 n=1 Tax=Copidosoma floridanum TaxID=29053 RepID=UPI0006C9A658|nr:uncharacterized protein LOC106642275 [Copidosoma floridanum]
MAVNKTPSSSYSFFSDLTASGGSSYMLPVRIKVTPNTSARPLSGKKQHITDKEILQPILIKDLFKNTQKDGRNSILSSVSTQKKSTHSQRSSQPYLTTQSCYKPKKNEVEEQNLCNLKSSGGNKVRRQLYTTLDSPQKFSLESKENSTKMKKPKKTISKNLVETISKKDQMNDNSRKSLLLPPNTIKNNYIRRSGSSFKTVVEQTTKTRTSDVNKTAKNTSQNTETKKSNYKLQNNDKEISAKSNKSSFNPTDRESQFGTKDNCSVTSPVFNRKTRKTKLPSHTDVMERPSVIMSPSKRKSKRSNKADIGLEKQNPRVSRAVCISNIPKTQNTSKTEVLEFDYTKINSSDQSSLIQLKNFLEKSLHTSESQALHLKRTLQDLENQVLQLNKAISCINTIISEKSEIEVAVKVSNDQVKECTEVTEKCNLSYTILDSDENLPIPVPNKNLETENNKLIEKIIVSENVNLSFSKEQQEKTEEKSKPEVLMPIRILVNDADLHQECSEASLETLNEVARLSTIGEVSCEMSSDVNESKKYDEKDHSVKDDKNHSFEDENYKCENKENIDDSANKMMHTPSQLKTYRRSKSLIDSCNSQRRRSARIAAKNMSHSMLSNSDRQDSFTLLENELNVVHKPPPSKSAPVSPIKVPFTPSSIKQWGNLRVPLKEYMALKIDGSFLVTPDVKKFQSRLEPTDTPSSRKSLSRKIFMELCDLYAESPEHN